MLNIKLTYLLTILSRCGHRGLPAPVWTHWIGFFATSAHHCWNALLTKLTWSQSIRFWFSCCTFSSVRFVALLFLYIVDGDRTYCDCIFVQINVAKCRRCCVISYAQLASPVVRASETFCDSNVVSSVPGRRTIGRLVPGWVTVFGRAYHLGM